MKGRRKQSVFVSPSMRVYEYVAADGTSYWSFTRSDRLVSPPLRLVLQNRVGTSIITYANRLRQMAQTLVFGPVPEPEPEVIEEPASEGVE